MGVDSYSLASSCKHQSTVTNEAQDATSGSSDEFVRLKSFIMMLDILLQQVSMQQAYFDI